MSAANFERELRVLEEALRRLSAEYDAFLYGSVPKPPIQTRRNVEEMVRRLNASEDMSAAERYRFGALQGRFTTLCDRWEKLQGEKEAGRRPGLYGHFREGGGGSGGPSASGRPTPGRPRPYKKSGALRRPSRTGSCSTGTWLRKKREEKT